MRKPRGLPAKPPERREQGRGAARACAAPPPHAVRGASPALGTSAAVPVAAVPSGISRIRARIRGDGAAAVRLASLARARETRTATPLAAAH